MYMYIAAIEYTIKHNVHVYTCMYVDVIHVHVDCGGFWQFLFLLSLTRYFGYCAIHMKFHVHDCIL